MSDKPNILIVLSDQMTPQLTGAYGHNVVKTPNLNMLCESGIRFDAAYTNSPICAPARASLISGRYVSEIGAYDNGVNFPADIPTFLHMLRLEGYDVVASGKMHYLGPDQLHGLEERLTQDIYPANYKWVPEWQTERASGIVNDKGHLVEHEKIGCREWTNQMNYDEETHSRALEYLRRRIYTRDDPKKVQDKPFCLIVSYTQPHSPYLTVKKYWDLYDDEEIELPKIMEGYQDAECMMDKWLRDYEGISEKLMNDPGALRTMRRAYYGMISYIDEKVGDLIDCLENLDLREDTAVIFAADHGDMVGERGFIEKRVFYEYSSRIPMIWSWPKKWKKGVAVADPVSLLDVCPTLIDLMDSDFPFSLPGRSLLEYLLKDSDKIQSQMDPAHRIVVSEYHCEGVLAPCFMVRRGKYKYIYVHGQDSQLFDLENDPDELRNLSNMDAFRQLANEFKAMIFHRFNPDAINENVTEKQNRCRYINKAMMSGKKTYWDLRPNPNEGLKYDQK